MPITWRNVDIGSNNGANALLNSGADRIMRGLDTLTNEAEKQGKLNTENYDTVAKLNTTDALAKLNKINTSTDLAAAMKGGILDTEVLDGTFGKQYDKGLVSNATTSKLTSLVSNEKAAAEKNKFEAERLADRAEDKRKSLITEARNAQAHAWTTQDHELKMQKLRREQQYSAQANAIMSSSTDPEIVKSRLSKMGLEINGDGLLPTNELFALEKSFTDQVNGTGLSAAARATQDFERDHAIKMTSDFGTKVDKSLSDLRKRGGFDDKTEQLVSDKGLSVGDAILAVETQIKDKGVTNTVPIASRVEEINNAFEKNGLDAPSGAMIKEILTQGGHDDKWFGFDAEFELNRDVVNNMISKVKKNKDYKDTYADAELEFLEAKAQGSDILNKTVTKNASERSQEAFAKRFSNQFKEAEVIPLDQVNQLLEERIKNLNQKFKAARSSEPTVIDALPKEKEAQIGFSGTGR